MQISELYYSPQYMQWDTVNPFDIVVLQLNFTLEKEQYMDLQAWHLYEYVLFFLSFQLKFYTLSQIVLFRRYKKGRTT